MALDKVPVIVATNNDDVVRVYVGFPRNGGMNQTGQFTVGRAIEPTDLANMVTDLGVTFGWLEVESTTPALVDGRKAIANATRKALPPAKAKASAKKSYPSEERNRQKIACPECEYVGTRKHMRVHLTNVHRYAKPRANLYGRTAPAIDREPIPAPVLAEAIASVALDGETQSVGVPTTPAQDFARSQQFWRQAVRCPVGGCDHVSRRSNLMSHLKSKTIAGHQYDAESARAAAKVAERADQPPAPKKAQPRGIAGQREREQTTYPAVLKMAEGGPIDSRSVGRRFAVDSGTAASWLRKLAGEGKLIATNLETRKNTEPVAYTLAPQLGLQSADATT